MPIEPHQKEDFLVYTAKWMSNHHEVPIIATLLYIGLIFGVSNLMTSRSAYTLKYPLVLWNVVLALFSIIGSVFFLPTIFGVIGRGGLGYEMCTLEAEYATPWVFIFCWSKLFEFIDTVFIVLRKRELHFLHYYHHLATMWFCWFAWELRLENGGMFAGMNLLVHSIMYSYYASVSYGRQWPLSVKMSITSLQIAQMVLGSAVIVYNMLYCNTHPYLSAGGLAMYLSYAYLFIDLYINNYVTTKKEKKEPQVKKEPLKAE